MIKGLLYPPVCYLCGKGIGREGERFCPACQKRLAGKPRLYRTDGEFFDLCLTPFAYADPLAETLQGMKRRENPAQARMFAEILADMIEEQGLSFDLVTCIPEHWQQKLVRGFNHSEEIATRLARLCRTSYKPLLQKHQRNKRQSSLGQKERKANVYGVYRLNRWVKENVAGKTILVVDDIVTTGSTLGEVARVLKMGGAKRVLCVTVAKSING